MTLCPCPSSLARPFLAAIPLPCPYTPCPLPLQVGTLETGEIDYDELRERLVENSHRPAILNVNIGTTVKGAVDDLDRVGGAGGGGWAGCV